MNSDEAEKCFEKGMSHFNNSDYATALKFFTKSARLNNTEKAFTYMNKCTEKLNDPNHHKHNEKVKETSQPQHEEKAKEKNYTSAQLDEIKKMKVKKDFYEILGVSKESTDDEIKKQYRKLALKFHPDKNRAPGSDDVFKKIAQAYDCLSNKDKRATYDRYGNEAPEDHYRHYQQYYSQDINPEDIFDFFFSSNFGSGFTYRRQHHRGYNNEDNRNRREYQNGNARVWSLFQFLPLIFILLSSFAYNFSKEEPLYSISRTRKYSEQRFSKTLRVPYYVDSRFSENYPDTTYEFAKIEHEIEIHHVNQLRNNCEIQRAYKARLEYQARLYYGVDQHNLLEKAKRIDLSSCYEFEKLKDKINHLYY